MLCLWFNKAIMHLLHFDFAGAWDFNKLSFIVFPMMGYFLG